MTIDPLLAFLGFILWGRSGSGGSPTTTTIPAKTPPVWNHLTPRVPKR